MANDKRGGARQRTEVSETLVSEVVRLTKAPYLMSAPKIAERLGISERTVFRVRAASRVGAVAPGPRSGSDLDKAWQDVRMQYWAWREVVDIGGQPSKHEIALAADAFRTFFLAFSGETYLPRHCLEWILDFFSYDLLLLNVPPRHAKSEIMTVWLSIFEIAMDRNIQILLISGTVDQAKKFSRKIAWHLEFNRKLVAAFGRFKPTSDATPWGPLSGELMVEGRERGIESGDMTLQIRGIGQKILGMEADRIRADDPVGRDSATSSTTRENLSEYWHGDALSRQSPICRVTIIGQRIHHQDLYGELADELVDWGPKEGKPLYRHIIYPAVLDHSTQKVLWPEFWPYEKLMARRNQLKKKTSSWIWEAMYQQNPTPQEDRLVREEWIYGNDSDHPGCLDLSRAGGVGMYEWGPRDNEKADWWVRACSLDPSPTRSAGMIIADVWHSRDDMRCGILEARRKKMDVREMKSELARAHEQYRYRYLIFEQNAAQRWFLQDAEFMSWARTQGVIVIPHTTGKHKTDPVFGLQSIAVAFENGKIRLPWGDRYGKEMSQQLIDEALIYPHGPYSDLLMALWFIAFNHSKLTPPPGTANDQKPGPGFTHVHNQGWAAFTR